MTPHSEDYTTPCPQDCKKDDEVHHQNQQRQKVLPRFQREKLPSLLILLLPRGYQDMIEAFRFEHRAATKIQSNVRRSLQSRRVRRRRERIARGRRHMQRLKKRQKRAAAKIQSAVRRANVFDTKAKEQSCTIIGVQEEYAQYYFGRYWPKHKLERKLAKAKLRRWMHPYLLRRRLRKRIRYAWTVRRQCKDQLKNYLRATPCNNQEEERKERNRILHAIKHDLQQLGIRVETSSLCSNLAPCL